MKHVPPAAPSTPSWVGGHTVQQLIALTDYEQFSVRERRAIIERIEAKQDQYQRWLCSLRHSPQRTEEIQQIKATLVALKAKKLEIYTSLQPAFKGLIHRASHPTQQAA